MSSTSIDKQAIAESFSKAASHYDDFAFIQREIGERLFERLSYMKLSPQHILDVGCGTGYFTRALKKKYAKAKVSGVDIAEGMIQVAVNSNGWFNKCHYQCADMDALPFDDNSIDLLFSNLAIQWSSDTQQTFAEFSRVIKPGGLIIFTTLGPDTLIELKQAWQAVDRGVHVNEFIDMHDVGDDMMRAGISQPVMDMEKLVFKYDTVRAIFQDLKGIGAHNINQGRPGGLMSKGKWQAMLSHYQTFQSDDQQFPATYEVIYGHGWGQETKTEKTGDVYKVSLP